MMSHGASRGITQGPTPDILEHEGCVPVVHIAEGWQSTGARWLGVFDAHASAVGIVNHVC